MSYRTYVLYDLCPMVHAKRLDYVVKDLVLYYINPAKSYRTLIHNVSGVSPVVLKDFVIFFQTRSTRGYPLQAC